MAESSRSILLMRDVKALMNSPRNKVFALSAASAACECYAGVFVLISIAFYITLHTAFRECALDPDAPPQRVQRFRRDYRLGPPLYLLAVLSAPFSPMLSMGICTALWIFWAITTGDCV